MTDRAVSWGGLHNARDLGGLPVATTVTRRGRVFRTPRLDGLDEQGWTDLVDAGVRTIVDLRNPHEIEPLPLPAGVTRHHRPIEVWEDRDFMARWGGVLDSPEYYRANLDDLAGADRRGRPRRRARSGRCGRRPLRGRPGPDGPGHRPAAVAGRGVPGRDRRGLRVRGRRDERLRARRPRPRDRTHRRRARRSAGGGDRAPPRVPGRPRRRRLPDGRTACPPTSSHASGPDSSTEPTGSPASAPGTGPVARPSGPPPASGAPSQSVSNSVGCCGLRGPPGRGPALLPSHPGRRRAGVLVREPRRLGRGCDRTGALRTTVRAASRRAAAR